MRRGLLVLALLGVMPLPARLVGQLRPAAAIEARIDSLLAKMTLEEKVGQLVLQSFRSISREDSTTPAPEMVQSVREGKLGGMLNAVGARLCGGIQRFAVEDSRLKIRLLYGADAVHGHNNVYGAAIFPHHIGLGATRDTALVQ